MDYVGTLCVEFFIDDKDNLLVNEIAPRVHNSGHMTINSHNISQFENHIRAVCGLKKIKTLKLYNAKMTNILGNEITKYKGNIFQDNELLIDYLKKEIRKKVSQIKKKKRPNHTVTYTHMTMPTKRIV